MNKILVNDEINKIIQAAEMLKILVESEEDKKEATIDRLIGNPSSQSKFFHTAVDIQKHAYNAGYSEMKREYACDVLIRCGYCSGKNCDKCYLEESFQEAQEEIANHVRAPKKVPKKGKK